MLCQEIGEKVNRCYLHIGVCKMKGFGGKVYYFVEKGYKLGHTNAGRLHSSEFRRGGFPREELGVDARKINCCVHKSKILCGSYRGRSRTGQMVSPSSGIEIPGLKRDKRNGSSRILDNKDNIYNEIHQRQVVEDRKGGHNELSHHRISAQNPKG
jgi:hypothetical protein